MKKHERGNLTVQSKYFAWATIKKLFQRVVFWNRLFLLTDFSIPNLQKFVPLFNNHVLTRIYGLCKGLKRKRLSERLSTVSQIFDKNENIFYQYELWEL